MTNVFTFGSYEEMQAYLLRARTEAEKSLHHIQHSMTHGDFWVRFIDVANRVVEFGRIATPEEVYEQEVTTGATSIEARRFVQQTVQSLNHSMMYGIAYSRYNRDGEWGWTHKALVWPVEESLFHAAAEVNWQVDLLPASAKINLNAAYLAIKGHVREAAK